jgi:anti-sigma factor RsiW
VIDPRSSDSAGSSDADSSAVNRRDGNDRRRSTFKALLVGGFNPRRRASRRDGELQIAGLDWHPARLFGVAFAILLLSVCDAFLTLTLINLGATEINPFMEPLVTGSGRAFAIWKLGLTSVGVILLTLLARVRAFGWIPVGGILYTVLAVYIALVGYELWLLEYLSSAVYEPT